VRSIVENVTEADEAALRLLDRHSRCDESCPVRKQARRVLTLTESIRTGWKSVEHEYEALEREAMEHRFHAVPPGFAPAAAS